ncbi:hypothetical protein RRG08_029275 [Elysia crispata]|uniref:Uncharacterized protein n=1 Tax=Elysia crispata TaxID=231223 RepID=A0AAE1A6L6_9GAST|nr:hypothetical protein RRG08_029275 [Elysia crispata]
MGDAAAVGFTTSRFLQPLVSGLLKFRNPGASRFGVTMGTSVYNLTVFALLYLGLVLYVHAGSTEPPPFARLSVQPATIDVNLTETLEMDCRLLGQRYSVSHIVSMVMLRQDVLVASVTSFDPAKAVSDRGSLMAFGTVDLSTNHLKLVWDHPTQAVSGNYTCEINAIDSFARPLTLMSTFTVSSRVPSVEVMIHHIRDLEKRADLMEERMALQSQRLSALENTMGFTEQTTTKTT